MNYRAAPNGTLTRELEFGWVWTTECRGCGTRQRIRIGAVPLDQATDAIAILNITPMECPRGFHVELGGWIGYWSLDLMLARYAAALRVQSPLLTQNAPVAVPV